MADEEVKEQAAEPGKKKGRLVPILIIAGMMIGEGVGVFFLAKTISPDPSAAIAVEGESTDGGSADEAALMEIELAECRPSNKMGGKLIAFHIRVSGLVSSKDFEAVKEMVETKQGRIEDSVNIVIRSSEPKHFNEPGLETIKRRLKKELDRILNDPELIKGVLIPQFLQS